MALEARMMAVSTGGLSLDEREALARLINLECDALECSRCRRIRWRIAELLRTYEGARDGVVQFLTKDWV